MSDWDAYAEAVTALARIPALEAERRQVIESAERSAVSGARAELDAEVRRCDEWTAEARRAVTNAEAKLVAAHVLIPDGGPSVEPAPPARLATDLHDCEEELRAALSGLGDARRGAARDKAAAAARAAAAGVRRRRVLRIGSLVAGVLVILVLGYLAGR